MNTQELHDGFQTELIRRGMPVDYAKGAAEELADHHRDVVEELRATGLDNSAAETEAANRPGDQRQLVKKSVREFQRRHWCGRWPLATFLFGPIVLLAGTWVASGLILACLALLAGDSGPATVTPGIGLMADYMITRLVSSWFVLLLPATGRRHSFDDSPVVLALLLALWRRA